MKIHKDEKFHLQSNTKTRVFKTSTLTNLTKLFKRHRKVLNPTMSLQFFHNIGTRFDQFRTISARKRATDPKNLVFLKPENPASDRR
jgi:hypothetical protein